MKYILICCLLVMSASAFAQEKSPKRGICWDEKTQKISDAPLAKMLPGVSWIYNWGESPTGSSANLSTEGDITFAPMAWGRNFDEKAIRDYVKDHKSVKYLLGFNEPNFAAQSNMTPSEAAALWPTLEAIASEYDLRLVSPALNFSGEQVGGRVWGIYDWLDEFIRAYKVKFNRLPRLDCLALHCYMNWYGAATWFANEYLYSDIFKDGNGTKYPNLVEILNSTKESTGKYPPMMLTEFCSWEGDKDGFVTNVDNQIDQMTQRIQKLEQSDIVEGYAWFMANADASSYPYMSAFQSNTPESELSTLGKVFVHMSAFDTSRYYSPGETVEAQDYVDATTDNQIVRIRPNSEPDSEYPLQIELTKASSGKEEYSCATYQIEVPADGSYTFSFHALTTDSKIRITAGSSDKEFTIAGHPGKWADYEATIDLRAGKMTVKIANTGMNSVLINSWKFNSAGESSIDEVPTNSDSIYTVYNLQGIRIGTTSTLSGISLKNGIYILVAPDGTSHKIVKSSPR